MLNGAELKALPAQFAIDPTVNGTNYYRMVSAGLGNWRPDIGTFTGLQPGDKGFALSLSDTIVAYDKLEDPNYSSAITWGALMLVVLIALHNAFLYFLLHRARAWVRAATDARRDKKRQAHARCMNDSLNKCGSFCGIGALIERVFRLKPPQDIQEMVARKSARATSSRVSPDDDVLPEADVVNHA